jgi:nucleotide-binding universal stress UspA family protein
MYRHLLVPLDESDRAIETVNKAVNLARTLGARVSFLHVHDADASPAKADAMPNGYAGTHRERAHALMTKAEAAARALGVPCDSVVLEGQTPHEIILDTARKGGCDLIFMAPHGRKAARGDALGSQTMQVLTSGETPVLVSSAQDMGHAHPMIELILGEHRALAAVLHAWLYLLNQAASQDRAVAVELMRSMGQYIIKYPLALHRPSEHDYLFFVLRGRTAVVHAELDELERQHERERAMAESLGDEVEHYALGHATLEQLRDAVGTYAHFMWEHMGRVEGVVLPAAQRYLSEADWNEIQASATRPDSFRANGEAQAAYRQLFSRIAELAPT